MWCMVNCQKQTSSVGTETLRLCDCEEITEILEHEGIIPMILYWDKELLGKYFSIELQNKKTMTDVDTLTRIFGKFISIFCIIASILYSAKKQKRPKSYVFANEKL